MSSSHPVPAFGNSSTVFVFTGVSGQVSQRAIRASSIWGHEAFTLRGACETAGQGAGLLFKAPLQRLGAIGARFWRPAIALLLVIVSQKRWGFQNCWIGRVPPAPVRQGLMDRAAVKIAPQTRLPRKCSV